MASLLDWATAVHAVNGQPQKHVSFPSFVKEFGIRDMDDAISSYMELLKSPRIKLNRRERLKANFADLVQRRLPVFGRFGRRRLRWRPCNSSWSTAPRSLPKKTAVVASLQDSSMLSGILLTRQISGDASHSTKVPTIHPGNGMLTVLTFFQPDCSKEGLSPPLRSYIFAELFFEPLFLWSRNDKNLEIDTPKYPAVRILTTEHNPFLVHSSAHPTDESPMPPPKPVPYNASSRTLGLARAAETAGTEDSITDLYIVGSSRAKATPFYELIAFVFKKAKGKAATLPHAVPRGLSKNHEELYRAALAGCVPQVPSWPRRTFSEAGRAKYTSLRIINPILNWIDIGLFVPPTSEHVYVSTWIMLLNNLFNGSGLRIIPGEFVSSSSTAARDLTEEEFDQTMSTVSGHKIDMSLRIQIDNVRIIVRSSTLPRRKRLNPFVVVSPSKKDKLNGGGAGGDHTDNYDDDDDADK
ncbi:hypothetical protein EC957_009674 [Mortierella hygrophila]|uniref:Uncharacterized protein n=1 Tax=Mortierella hygrophila TaxID=979708 RepID=A0A9P6JXQ6_9FUNG|nr:hypothetical protein EC957_009674 [Mortierella hygrophila]